MVAPTGVSVRTGTFDAGTPLGTDPGTYTQLADRDTATDKARRDAPSIAVCDFTNPSD